MTSPERIDLQTLSNIDSYRIEKTISTEGGFGDVVLGIKNGQEYAIKILRLWEIHPNERKSVSARFYREYEAGSIDSPYLVKSEDSGEYCGNPYLVMEFVPFGSLRDVMDKKVVLGNPIELSIKILLGLQELHKNGIVHRDLKPENVLIGHQQAPKLTDFGISGFMYSRETKTNWMGRVKEMFGTIAYAPPEQFDQFKAFTAMRPTIDIFSFGIMIYEYLTGHYPFGPIETAEDVILYKNRMKKRDYDPLSKYITVTDPRWNHIIGKCIDVDIKKRFQSVEELLNTHFKSELAQIGLSQEQETSNNHQNESAFNKPYLMIMNGEEPKKQYALTELLKGETGLLSIGYFFKKHSGTNDIEIAEENTQYISRFHATLEKHANSKNPWLLRDGQFRQKEEKWAWHNSTNGTYVNSKKVDENGLFLSKGDIITIGDTTIKFDY
ncbi:MAG: kinase [Bacteroidetes bacterium 4572_77]|nr:MAG: kinase [Bacteroidetes bacterium 4572_77]